MTCCKQLTSVHRKLKMIVFLIGWINCLVDGLTLNFDEKTHHVQESGSNCVVGIAEIQYEPSTIICVVNSGLMNITNFKIGQTTSSIILRKLMEKSKWTLMMKFATAEQIDMDIRERVHNYILFMKSEADFEKILNMLLKTQSWNPHAKFLIYFEGYSIRYKELVAYFIENFWKKWVLNVTLLIPDSVDLLHRIFLWHPFEQGHCGDQQRDFVEIGVCHNSSIIPNDTIIFPNKVPLDMKGCPIKLATVVWPPFVMPQLQPNVSTGFHSSKGIEMDMFYLVASHANFSPVITSFDTTENFGGMMDLLEKGKTDIAIGTLAPSVKVHERFDFSIQYFEDHIAWIVPVSETIPKWQSLMQIFEPAVWLMSCMAYISVAFVIYALGKNFNNLEAQVYTQLPGTFLVTWSILLGISLPITARSVKLRAFIFLWAVFAIHWSTAYTTSLTSTYTTSQHGQELQSVEDILEKGFKFGLTNETIRYFEMEKLTKDRIAAQVLKNHVLCESVEICLERISGEKNFVMAVSRLYFDHIEIKYRDETGKPTLRALQHDVVSIPIEMLLVKGFPLLNRINDIQLRLIEAGLIDFSSKLIEYTLQQQQNKYIDDADKKVLSLNHLQGAFMILGIGLFFSIVCILVELTWFYYQCCKKMLSSNSTM